MRDFLLKYFNEKQIEDILENYTNALESMIIEQKPRLSAKQHKLARTRILDRIAFYKSIRKYVDEDKALAYAKEYYYEKVKVMSNFMKKVGKSSFGCKMFQKAFVKGLKSDAWVSVIEQNDKRALVFNITRCVYKDLCDFYGCSNFCKLFCDGDWVMFGEMEKLKFSREFTLGYGDELCDFKFVSLGK